MSIKIPKTIGGVADLLQRMRGERHALQAKIDEMGKKEKEIKEVALGMLNRSHLDSARGKTATITKVVKEVPSVQDWDRVYKYVKEHDATDLFERRIHRQAWRDRVEADGAIPGIQTETILDLHLHASRVK